MFLSSPSIPHTVGETTLQFHPMSLNLAGKLRVLAGPVVRALTVLFAKHDTDVAQKSEAKRVGDNVVESSSMTLAIAPDLAAERYKQQQAAVTDLVTAVTSEETLKVICTIIVDSLRDEYPERPIKPETVAKFQSEVTLPRLTPLIIGVAKANKELFGPLADLVPLKMEGLRRTLGAGTETKETPEPTPAAA